MPGEVAHSFSEDFMRIFVAFAGAYPRAHERFGASEDMLVPYNEAYIDVLQKDIEAIHSATHEGIRNYQLTYEVPISGPDIWKLIYFTGKAIHDRIQNHVPPEVPQIHLMTMLGLLHLTLMQQAKLKKDLLRKEVETLIRRGAVFDELGETGAYVIYKALSTSAESKIA